MLVRIWISGGWAIAIPSLEGGIKNRLVRKSVKKDFFNI